MINNIHDHGSRLDTNKRRISCNYCYKVVSGFSRLRYHLGGVKGDVMPCEKVPLDVQTSMRDEISEMKLQRLNKEMGQLQYPDLALKRHFCFRSVEFRSSEFESAQTALPRKRKEAAEGITDDTEKYIFTPSTRISASEEIPCRMEDRSRSISKCIGRFFYDAAIDLDAAKSPHFKSMLEAFSKFEIGFRVLDHQELKGWVFQDVLEEMIEHVEVRKLSWERTGCSILLDGWTDRRGRKLINFLVGCPAGVVYLRSVDVTEIIGDVDAFLSLLSSVLEEVGVKNTVQIITYNTSVFMKAVGKRLMEKHRNVFWTVCAVHCIGQIFEEIQAINNVAEVLDMTKTLIRFIYSRASSLSIMKSYTGGKDLIKTSRIRPATPFLTLLNIVFEKENLKNMFNSSTWNSSIWASTVEGKRIAELVRDVSFWAGAEGVSKAVDPLVCVFDLIGVHEPLMGYIYETMDQAKETIKSNLRNKKDMYLPYWKIIDVIWDDNLHSPLHSAGYFLNPSLFYSTGFCADAEVSNGLLGCILRMAEDQRAQDLIVPQLELYRASLGGFAQEIAVDQRRETPPALWWSLYGGHCPELQRLAIRILSQTCIGACSHNFKRCFMEQLHTEERCSTDQHWLQDMAFVHCNLRLQHPSNIADETTGDLDQEELEHWIDDAEELVAGDGDIGSMMDDAEKVIEKGCSGVQVKGERL